jgi:hypothetical protein
MKKLLVVAFALAMSMLVGCASQPAIDPFIETPGPLQEVHKTSSTETTPSGTTSSSSEDSVELTPAMAELKMKLAILEAEVAKATVDPCRGAFAPSYCYGGVGFSGGNVSYGSAGVNTTYSTGTSRQASSTSGSVDEICRNNGNCRRH